MNAQSRPVRIRPVVLVYKGDGRFVSLPRYAKQCDAQFLVDEEYPMSILEARSRASHNHYFAWLAEAFDNMPEKQKDRFKDAEGLRAKALVETGWCTEKNFVCDTADHALQLAANIRERSPYAVIIPRDNVVVVYDALSQSAAAMGKESFEKSKHDVIDWVSDLLGVKPGELKKNAGRSA